MYLDIYIYNWRPIDYSALRVIATCFGFSYVVVTWIRLNIYPYSHIVAYFHRSIITFDIVFDGDTRCSQINVQLARN